MEGKALVAAGCMTVAVATGARAASAHERVTGNQERDQPELTILVYTEIDIPWLAAAQTTAGGLFDDAGITIAWIFCSPTADYPGCHRAPTANELVVRIRRQRSTQPSHTCGIALSPQDVVGSFITLFHDCVARGSKDLRVKQSIVAGYSLAHEIAHLLLPVGAHAASGIMQRRMRPIDWQRAVSGGLRFLPEEQRQMVEAVRLRLAPTR